ncbi:MAG TPA: ribonuclease R [Pseudobacteroides sp.]|uniref:ribonuclease R n=1 Tax=Pseudobacteroides sp. TaxID=1968840 RepID=UPI002F944D38
MSDMRQDRKKRIVSFMKEDAYKPLLFKELVAVLDVPKDDIADFENVLTELEQEGKIYKTRRDRYGIPERMSLVSGRLQGSEKGFGFVIPDEEDTDDVFIPAHSLHGAMHNDRVIARVNKGTAPGKRSEGEILKVLKRANTNVVGTFESSKYFGFVIPDDKRLGADIFIPKDEVNGAQTGHKVVVELIKWPEQRRNAEGRIIEIIGDKDEPGTDIISIIKSHNLVQEFSEAALRQAEGISETVPEEAMNGRRDLKGMRMVTIDGEDAKDLDDAVSVQRLPDGNYRLGVHIADVSYYVTENSPLDKDALKRGTSVYLVDRVIPMLPKKLSNGICSLNPQVDRLAFTVMMDIDKLGRIINHEIFESVINIDERMTYTNVYKILEEKDEDLLQRYDYLLDDFNLMKELALILRKKRFSRGAIDFDFDEAKIILNDKGEPVEIKKYEYTVANQIIEEFMLICNETVAEHFYWANAPFVYRIHEDPDTDKVQHFTDFLDKLGYRLKGSGDPHPKAYQDLLSKVKGKKEERIISTVMLRSLQKARYSHESNGHFGLAAKFYCHFTSPIRRYPDLIIHRIMKEYIKGNISESREDRFNEILPEIANHCSTRERAAEEAERETDDLKKVEYMKKHEGEVFDGIISSVTSFGMFVELDNTIEGLVRMDNMEDDYYIFDDERYMLIGERTRKIYSIGDSVSVQLAKADIAKRQIDFVLFDGKDEDGNGESSAGLSYKRKPKKARGKYTQDSETDQDISKKNGENYEGADKLAKEVIKAKRPRKWGGIDRKVKASIKGKKKKKKG